MTRSPRRPPSCRWSTRTWRRRRLRPTELTPLLALGLWGETPERTSLASRARVRERRAAGIGRGLGGRGGGLGERRDDRPEPGVQRRPDRPRRAVRTGRVLRQAATSPTATRDDAGQGPRLTATSNRGGRVPSREAAARWRWSIALAMAMLVVLAARGRAGRARRGGPPPRGGRVVPGRSGMHVVRVRIDFRATNLRPNATRRTPRWHGRRPATSSTGSSSPSTTKRGPCGPCRAARSTGEHVHPQRTGFSQVTVRIPNLILRATRYIRVEYDCRAASHARGARCAWGRRSRRSRRGPGATRGGATVRMVIPDGFTTPATASAKATQERSDRILLPSGTINDPDGWYRRDHRRPALGPDRGSGREGGYADRRPGVARGHGLGYACRSRAGGRCARARDADRPGVAGVRRPDGRRRSTRPCSRATRALRPSRIDPDQRGPRRPDDPPRGLPRLVRPRVHRRALDPARASPRSTPTGSGTSSATSGRTVPIPPLRTTRAAFPLDEWPPPGRIDDEATPAREEYGYDGVVDRHARDRRRGRRGRDAGGLRGRGRPDDPVRGRPGARDGWPADRLAPVPRSRPRSSAARRGPMSCSGPGSRPRRRPPTSTPGTSRVRRTTRSMTPVASGPCRTWSASACGRGHSTRRPTG